MVWFKNRILPTKLIIWPENGLNWDEAISFIKSNTNLELWVKGRKLIFHENGA